MGRSKERDEREKKRCRGKERKVERGKRKDMNQIYVNAMRVPKIVRSPFYNNCATLSDDNTLNPSSIMYVRSLVTLNQGLRQNGKTRKKKDRKQDFNEERREMRDQRKRRKMNKSGDKKGGRGKNIQKDDSLAREKQIKRKRQ